MNYYVFIFSVFMSLGCPGGTEAPKGDLSNCNHWVTYDLKLRNTIYSATRTNHFKNGFSDDPQDIQIGTPWGLAWLVFAAEVKEVKSSVNECNGNTKVIHWLDAYKVPGIDNTITFRDQCVQEDCSDSQTSIVF